MTFLDSLKKLEQFINKDDKENMFLMKIFCFPRQFHCFSCLLLSNVYSLYLHDRISLTTNNLLNSLKTNNIIDYIYSNCPNVAKHFWDFLDDSILGLKGMINHIKDEELKEALTFGAKSLLQFHTVDTISKDNFENIIWENDGLFQQPVFVLSSPQQLNNANDIPVILNTRFDSGDGFFALQSMIIYYSSNYHLIFIRGKQMIDVSSGEANDVSEKLLNDSCTVLMLSYYFLVKGQTKNYLKIRKPASNKLPPFDIPLLNKVISSQFSEWKKNIFGEEPKDKSSGSCQNEENSIIMKENDDDDNNIGYFLANCFAHQSLFIMIFQNKELSSISLNNKYFNAVQIDEMTNDYYRFQAWLFSSISFFALPIDELKNPNILQYFKFFLFFMPLEIQFCKRITYLYIDYLLSHKETFDEIKDNDQSTYNLLIYFYIVFNNKFITNLFKDHDIELQDDPKANSFGNYDNKSKEKLKSIIAQLNKTTIPHQDFNLRNGYAVKFYENYKIFIKNVKDSKIKDIIDDITQKIEEFSNEEIKTDILKSIQTILENNIRLDKDIKVFNLDNIINNITNKIKDIQEKNPSNFPDEDIKKYIIETIKKKLKNTGLSDINLKFKFNNIYKNQIETTKFNDLFDY